VRFLKSSTYLIPLIIIIAFNNNPFSDWVPIGNFTNPGFNWSISVVDSNTFWIAGGDSGQPFIWRSTNGGISISQISTSGISYDLYCVWGIDANNCYVGDGGAPMGTGGNAKVYLTTNSGTTWNTILSTGGTRGFINGIVFSRIPPQIGVVESDPPQTNGPYWWELTTNGGISWTQINGPNIPNLSSAENSVVCIDELFWGVGSSSVSGNTGKWIFTSNGGVTFNNILLPLTGAQAYVSSVSFNTDKLNGVAVLTYSLPNLARTTNGGLNWMVSNVGAGVTGRCTMRWVPGTNTIYLIGQTGNLLGRKSTDGGFSWSTMSTVNISNFTHMDLIKEGNNVYGYAVTENGVVCKMVDPVVGINNNSSEVPTRFKLEQNYPNPFNPTSTINYSLPNTSVVTLKIYDILGNEAMTVVNEYKHAGNYSVNVDASKLASGMYFYTLSARGGAGDFKDSKKMVVIK
jgi:photosystem II stability/assembly factor-like uncharacterized protein